MAFLDLVRFDGLKSKEWLIYKHPSDRLVMGARLIVQEGQVAIFTSKGTVADIFYPGTYNLSTENLPILNRLVSLPYGGNTPFSAEIYYVNTTARLEINWGTTDPIQLVDPKYFVKLRVRAFGQMGLRVSNVSVMFRDLIGGMQQSEIVSYEKLKKYYKGILVLKVKSMIADAIITNKISALEISARLEQLSEDVRSQLETAFDRYGFSLVSFYIQSVNFPDEDFERINRILEDRAAFEIMGDDRYSTKRSFDVYESAAQNSSGVAGVMAAGGVGLGAAIGMGSAMGRAVGNPLAGEEAKGRQAIKCPACGEPMEASMRFCPQCGASMSGKVCECGEKVAPGMKFCPGCGKRIE